MDPACLPKVEVILNTLGAKTYKEKALAYLWIRV